MVQLYCFLSEMRLLKWNFGDAMMIVLSSNVNRLSYVIGKLMFSHNLTKFYDSVISKFIVCLSYRLLSSMC